MVTPEPSESWPELIRDYLQTRFPLARFLPCAVVLVLASIASIPTTSPGGVLLSLGLALTLVLQFRLVDDLADLSRDRAAHPHRVLVGSPSRAPFWSLAAALFFVNSGVLAVAAAPADGLLPFLALCAGLSVWYLWLRRQFPGRVLGYHVILVKYPLFVYLLSRVTGQDAAHPLPMGLVYLLFLLYEVAHDPSLRAEAAARRAAAAALVLFLATSIAMAAHLAGHNVPSALVSVAVGTLGCCMMAAGLKHTESGSAFGAGGYAVFAFGLGLIVNFLIGAGS